MLRRGTPVPYCIADVTIEEGMTMLANLVDCDFDAVHIRMRMRLRVRFAEAGGGAKMPVFAPAGEEASR